MLRGIPRGLVILKPKQPFADWLGSWPEEDEITLEEAFQDSDAILIPACDTEEEAMAFVRANVERLFEHVLDDWCSDSSLWPKQRDYRTFCHWFDVDFHSIVFDAVEDGGQRFELNYHKDGVIGRSASTSSEPILQPKHSRHKKLLPSKKRAKDIPKRLHRSQVS
jgi:hypothetical protein